MGKNMLDLLYRPGYPLSGIVKGYQISHFKSFFKRSTPNNKSYSTRSVAGLGVSPRNSTHAFFIHG